MHINEELSCQGKLSPPGAERYYQDTKVMALQHLNFYPHQKLLKVAAANFLSPEYHYLKKTKITPGHLSA